MNRDELEIEEYTNHYDELCVTFKARDVFEVDGIRYDPHFRSASPIFSFKSEKIDRISLIDAFEWHAVDRRSWLDT